MAVEQAVPKGRSVLIGFAESLAAVESAWSLLDGGFAVIAFTRRGRRPPLRRASDVRVLEIADPGQDCAAAVDDLRGLMERELPLAVMPLDDAALWLVEAARLGLPVPVHVAGPTGWCSEVALDKRCQLRLAAAAGFEVPPTITVQAPDEGLDRAIFPCVAKPALAIEQVNGRLGRGTTSACTDEEGLRAAVAGCTPSRPMLIQPLLTGVGEGLFGLGRPHGVEGLSAHRRLRMMNPSGSGSSACVSRRVEGPDAERTARLVALLGWQGMFMIELLRDHSGRAWFMELNGRAWGSMALAREMGFEYPAWAVQQLLRPEFDPTTPAPRPAVVCRHLGRELIHLLMVFRGPKSSAYVDWPARFGTFRSVLTLRRSDRWYNQRPGANRIFLDDAWQTVRGQLSRGRRA